MFIINSIAINNDQVFGVSNTGYLYIWDFTTIFDEYCTRADQRNQNTLIYRASHKIQLSQYSITQVKIINGFLFIAIENKLYQIQITNIGNELNLIQTFPDNIEFLHYSKELYVAVGSRLYILDVEHDSNVPDQIDILKSVNENVQSLVQIDKVKITCICDIGNNYIAIGSDIGIIGIWDKATWSEQQILKFQNKRQPLSCVYQLIYNEEDQKIISLHQDYLVNWNYILGFDDNIQQQQHYHQMCIYNKQLYLTKGNREIVIFGTNQILQSSSEIILQLSSFEFQDDQVLIGCGSSPFVDVYVNGSYALTLSAF